MVTVVCLWSLDKGSGLVLDGGRGMVLDEEGGLFGKRGYLYAFSMTANINAVPMPSQWRTPHARLEIPGLCKSEKYCCLMRDSFHIPISASSIILAGDSSGGSLCLALLKLLLHFKRNNTALVPFCNNLTRLPLPAGPSILSAYCDPTDSLK